MIVYAIVLLEILKGPVSHRLIRPRPTFLPLRQRFRPSLFPPCLVTINGGIDDRTGLAPDGRFSKTLRSARSLMSVNACGFSDGSPGTKIGKKDFTPTARAASTNWVRPE
jgi:hypothetical protein